MAISDHPILLSCLQLLVSLFVGKENLGLHDTIDWEQASDQPKAGTA